MLEVKKEFNYDCEIIYNYFDYFIVIFSLCFFVGTYVRT